MRNASGQTGMTDHQFIALWKDTGGRAKLVAEASGMTIRAAYDRRAKIEKRHTLTLPSAGDNGKHGRGDAGIPANDYLRRLTIDGFSGVAVVFSDAHYHPGIGSTMAHNALLEVVRDLKPKLVIGNGDLLDGARISRFPRDGWCEQPRMVDELDEVKERLAEIRAAYRGARHIRTTGNHDIRFDRYLAMNASEAEGIAGFRLADHLPEWEECMSVAINSTCMVKHRNKGGIHSGFRNTLEAGWSTVTGHTHLLDAKFWADYNGPRWGVSGGCIAEVGGPQFGYTEDNPKAWCSGFVVLTFDKEGRLLEPEICRVMYGAAYFRGKIVAGQRRKVAA